MKNVFIELLNAHTTTVGDKSLFNSAKAVALDMDKTLNTVACKTQSRQFAMDFCQMIKNSSAVPISYTYPDGTTVSFDTKAEIVADCATNFSTYWASID